MKILILTTYPIGEPTHGGQHRVRNIFELYLAAGHAVEVVGVLGSEQYPLEKGFVKFPGISRLSKHYRSPFLMEDYCIGKAFSQEPDLFACLKDKIKISPDIIQVEHPWLFEFAIRVRETYPQAKVIYSSHNIEWKLKQDLLSSFVGAGEAKSAASLIKNVELDAVNRADAVVCVSDSDKSWIEENRECIGDIVLSPNGVRPWEVTDSGRRMALEFSKRRKYALYCASGHPPNITGFFEVFGNGFGSLKPDERLVIAGGAGESIAGDIRVHQSPKLAERVDIAGVVSHDLLAGFLDMAHSIVLPLTQGGGTNLKTAEALWAGKHIVATSVAMRGYEDFKNSPGVIVADDSASFKRALRYVMGLPELNLAESEIAKRRSVLWESCLKPLPGLLESLFSEVKV